jgi:uncharacterized protein YjdB
VQAIRYYLGGHLRHLTFFLLLLICCVGTVGCGGDDNVNVINVRALSGLQLSPRTFNVGVGQTQQLQMNASYSDGSSENTTAQATSWRSSNPAIASVTQSGLVTGVAPGVAIIESEFNGFTTSATATVTGQAP